MKEFSSSVTGRDGIRERSFLVSSPALSNDLRVEEMVSGVWEYCQKNQMKTGRERRARMRRGRFMAFLRFYVAVEPLSLHLQTDARSSMSVQYF